LHCHERDDELLLCVRYSVRYILITGEERLYPNLYKLCYTKWQMSICDIYKKNPSDLEVEYHLVMLDRSFTNCPNLAADTRQPTPNPTKYKPAPRPTSRHLCFVCVLGRYTIAATRTVLLYRYQPGHWVGTHIGGQYETYLYLANAYPKKLARFLDTKVVYNYVCHGSKPNM
jgi:hypothetical protein